VKVDYDGVGVDVPGDVKKVEALLGQAARGESVSG
jgi:hypothetical protein